MAKFIGRLVQLGIAKESSRGAGATPVFQYPRTALSFDDKIVQARSVGALGDLADSEEAFVTTLYGQGDMEAEIRDRSFGLFLLAMLGSVSTAGPTDSAYTHSFSLSNSNQHQSLSFLVTDSNTTELYKLVMLDSLELKLELDQIAMFTAGFVSKKGVVSGLSQPTLLAENKFTKKHLRFKVADSIAGLAGASAISLKSISLKFSKNTMLDDVLGTAEPEDILNRQLSIEGELMLNYEAETWKDYMRLGTNKTMEIAFINSDATIGASTRPSLTMQFPKVDFFGWEPDYSLDDIVKQKITFKCNRDVANALAIISSCQLVNTTTSY